MSNITEMLQELLTLDGAKTAALVDSGSGMLVGGVGSGIDLDIAAAGNTEVVQSKLSTMKALGLDDVIEDILITLGKQYHIIRPTSANPAVFIYLVLDKSKSNLAMARLKVKDVESRLSF